MNLATATAYQMKLSFQELWKSPARKTAAKLLDAWCQWVLNGDSKSPHKTPGPDPMRRVARTIKKNAQGILNYFDPWITNALFESIIFLVAGKLDFGLPKAHAK